MNRMRALAVLTAIALVLAGAGVIASSGFGDDQPPSRTPTVKWRKLSSVLVRVLEAERRSGRGLAVARSAGLRIRGTRLRVVVETRGARAVAERAIVEGGGLVVATHANLVQALVRPRALAALTLPNAVVLVRAPHAPVITPQRAVVPDS